MKNLSLCLLVLALSNCGMPELSGVGSGSGTDDSFESILMFSDAVGLTMTNAAALGTEMTNNISRVVIDLTDFTNVQGQFASSLTSATIQCRIEYSLNGGTNWGTLLANFAASTTANANTTSPFAAIPEAAKTTVLLRAVIVGNGVLDPVIRYVRANFN